MNSHVNHGKPTTTKPIYTEPSNHLTMQDTDTLLENGRARCQCGSLMRYRETTHDYKCTQCPHTVKLSDLTPMQPVKAND